MGRSDRTGVTGEEGREMNDRARLAMEGKVATVAAADVGVAGLCSPCSILDDARSSLNGCCPGLGDGWPILGDGCPTTGD